MLLGYMDWKGIDKRGEGPDVVRISGPMKAREEQRGLLGYMDRRSLERRREGPHVVRISGLERDREDDRGS